MECPICDSWNKTPHSKRFTTPIPPSYAEDAMIVGYWLGLNQPMPSDPIRGLCEKHTKAILILVGQDKRNKRRTAPTTPPPPSKIPLSLVMASMQQQPQSIPQNTSLSQPAPAPSEPPSMPVVIPPNMEGLRASFLGVAQSCAAEYIKQHPEQGQATVFDPTRNPPDTQLVTQVPPDVLRQALMTIVQNTKDPEAAEFAAKVLDGNMTPPAPSEPPTSGAFPCPLCHRLVKPGEVHSC